MTTLSFGNIDPDKREKSKNSKVNVLVEENRTCSVTTSGTVEVGDDITIQMTITVNGPCDARLAQKVRDRIAEIRSSAK